VSGVVVSAFRARRTTALAAFAFLAALAASAAASPLRDHPSPYLALHADDPVAWREWNEAALAEARAGDRLLLVSVGYFSCHWCHVMQRESFRNADIAARINERFIPVKVDRELEPALDARLSEFAEQLLGRSGWPLNVFVTPAGHPLFAVLYMPAGEFGEAIDRMHVLWTEQRERLAGLAARAGERELPEAAAVVDAGAARALQQVFVDQALVLHDDFQGGFGGPNKFPQAPALDYLVELAGGEGRESVREIVRTTLDAMAEGGLFDHVGGGFFRYVVDPGWDTPHFEKMLYDNAQLALVYLRAAPLFDERDYAAVARATLDFMRRELASGAGAMIASLSAVDGDGVEGGYYLYSDEDLERVLDDRELRVVRTHCDISGVPVLAAGHHLRCYRPLTHVARNMGLDEAAAAALFASARERLMAERARRRLPADDKLLGGWNGLALSAFSEAARRLGEPAYAETARRVRDYLVGELWREGRLARARAGGAEVGSASLEDYALVARGLWDHARLSGSEEDAALAREMLDAAFARFRAGNGWRLGEDGLLAPEPPRELVNDSPLESPPAVLADLALTMGIASGDDALVELARQNLNRAFEAVAANAFFHATHIRALNRLAAAR